MVFPGSAPEVAVGGNTTHGISLLGMSGAGKSFLTRSLARQGFSTISIDEVIRARLNRELGLGLASLAAVSDWMGFPDHASYPEKSTRYLEYEADAMQDALAAAAGTPDPVILDTTGSVIYLENDLLDRMREVTTVVHLETPVNVREDMLRAFRKKPTPLIWGDCFDHREGEDTITALVRSHPILVAQRETAYAQLAHFPLPYDERRRDGFDPAAFLRKKGLLSD